MRWVRTLYKSLVDTINLNRPFIYDPTHYDPYYLDKANYMPLLREADDDLAIVEMDIGLSRESRFAFEKYVKNDPEKIHVAPYKHYGYKPSLVPHSYIHRYSYMNFCKPGDPFCFYFGFGCVYLPLQKIRDFVTDSDARLEVLTDHSTKYRLTQDYANDVTFSMWHATVTDMEPVPIHWDLEPVHMNYSLTTRSGKFLTDDETKSEPIYDY